MELPLSFSSMRGVISSRKPYASKVNDAEWSLIALYPTLMRDDAPQRRHSWREPYNGLRQRLSAAVGFNQKLTNAKISLPLGGEEGSSFCEQKEAKKL